MRGMETNRIVFMIAHNRLRMSGIYHVSHQMQGLANLRSTIYKISDKQNLSSFRMRIDSTPSAIPHFLE